MSSGVQVLPGNAASVESDLRNFRKQHRWDPFLGIDKLDNIDEALASGNIEKEAAIDESLIQEDSPYPEVRASVRLFILLLCSSILAFLSNISFCSLLGSSNRPRCPGQHNPCLDHRCHHVYNCSCLQHSAHSPTCPHRYYLYGRAVDILPVSLPVCNSNVIIWLTDSIIASAASGPVSFPTGHLPSLDTSLSSTPDLSTSKSTPSSP